MLLQAKVNLKIYNTPMKPFQFLKEVSQQIRQISWPDKKTVLNLSLTVIFISLISSLVLGGFDLLFATTFAKISNSKQSNQQQLQTSPEFNFQDLATDSAQILESTPSAETQN